LKLSTAAIVQSDLLLTANCRPPTAHCSIIRLR
jgi:hypothetical protein